MKTNLLCLCLVLVVCQAVDAQTSSLGARERQLNLNKSAVELEMREAPPRPRNFVYERYGWIASTPVPPKTFKPGDLLTVIVREQKKWEADADLETKSKFDVKSELNAFVKPIDGGLGATTFDRGKPNIDYKYDMKNKSEGDSSREDKLTTRLTGKIIDVKPNGLLVIEARAKITHDEEISEITLVGTCRKEDVTADNTVLSTQIADKEVVVGNKGALRSAATRGFITKILDALKPF